VAGEEQALRFGLSKGTGDASAQPHPSLLAALMIPFREVHEMARQAGASDAKASRPADAPGEKA